MRRKIFAVLTVMSLLIIGSLLYVPGLFAHDEDEDKVKSEGGVRIFRVPAIGTKDGADPGDHPLIRGAEWELERKADGISMELETRELPPGAYSIWWLIDNVPGGGKDPVPPQVVGVEIVRLATGGVVGANGKGKFKATLAAALVPPANGATVLLNFGGNQVLNPMTARIGLAIRFHGPVVPGGVIEQTTLFAGGCNNTPLASLPGAGFPVAPDDITCYDPQLAEFLAP